LPAKFRFLAKSRGAAGCEDGCPPMEDNGRLNYKFRRSLRVRRKKDFQRVYEKGKSFVGHAGILYMLRLEKPAEKRFGVAAGKKLGNAVCRNRMKRMMREVCRRNQHGIKSGAAFVWIARRPLVGAKLEVFEKTFLKLAGKARILLLKKESAG
jgi:ribonuclease P protein component